jgi:hypothetical protein
MRFTTFEIYYRFQYRSNSFLLKVTKNWYTINRISHVITQREISYPGTKQGFHYSVLIQYSVPIHNRHQL